MMKPLRALTPLLPILVEATTYSTSLPPPTATLDSGPIIGLTTELPNAEISVNKFLGIPYAAPPIRFAKAQKPEPWTTPLNTSDFGPSCRQLFVDNELGPGKEILQDFFGNAANESEDCLFMNAFAPSTPGPQGGRPVVLFIHGGGWQQGNGKIDMSGFAAYEDIVAFSFNYRTNIFGFPNSPVIALEETNLGLFDQQLAIQWVQANAAAFGGDPKKVTIWGESAGSLSVDIHVNAYGGVEPPPFRGAIMFSGQMSVGLLGTTASPQDTSYWDATAKVLGCNNTSEQLQCMREVSADDLVKAMNTAQVAFQPINDNITLPSNRTQRWRDGKNAKVPVLMGTIAQEGRALVNRDINMATFNEAYLAEPLVTKKQREKIAKAYEGVPGLEWDFDKAAAIYTDFFWQCPQAILANISASIDNPTWRYYFNASITSLFPENFTWLGKFHGSDVALLFSTPTFEGDAGGVPLTPQLYTFANYLRGTVGRFIKNPRGGPGWPQVGSRYHPVDVANLGDVGDEKAAGVTVIKGSEVDERCALYKDIYPLIEQYVINM
ncbi:Fc.00g046910.m01.CDS01 [Cosmosporella sp. VM-42]